jgi:hypothetical protein
MMGRMMDRIRYYIDMEAQCRKRALEEPARREMHIADADAWKRLADMAKLISVKHAEMRDWISTFGR